ALLDPLVPLAALEPRVVTLALEHVRERADVELHLAKGQEAMLARFVKDLRDLLARRVVGANAEALDRDVIEKAPHRRETDRRRGEPAHDGHGHARTWPQEAHDDVDVDVLAARGGERGAQKGEPNRQARSDTSKAAEQRERRGVLQPVENVGEVVDAYVLPGLAQDQAERDR